MGTDPTSSVDVMATLMKTDDRELVRFLAIGCMLGGTYAEYICRKTGLDKTLPASSADPETIFEAVQELLARWCMHRIR